MSATTEFLGGSEFHYHPPTEYGRKKSPISDAVGWPPFDGVLSTKHHCSAKPAALLPHQRQLPLRQINLRCNPVAMFGLDLRQ